MSGAARVSAPCTLLCWTTPEAVVSQGVRKGLSGLASGVSVHCHCNHILYTHYGMSFMIVSHMYSLSYAGCACGILLLFVHCDEARVHSLPHDTLHRWAKASQVYSARQQLVWAAAGVPGASAGFAASS